MKISVLVLLISSVVVVVLLAGILAPSCCFLFFFVLRLLHFYFWYFYFISFFLFSLSLNILWIEFGYFIRVCCAAKLPAPPPTARREATAPPTLYLISGTFVSAIQLRCGSDRVATLAFPKCVWQTDARRRNNKHFGTFCVPVSPSTHSTSPGTLLRSALLYLPNNFVDVIYRECFLPRII